MVPRARRRRRRRRRPLAAAKKGQGGPPTTSSGKGGRRRCATSRAAASTSTRSRARRRGRRRYQSAERLDLKLVLSPTKAEWLLYADAPPQRGDLRTLLLAPVARMVIDVTKLGGGGRRRPAAASLLGGRWELCLPCLTSDQARHLRDGRPRRLVAGEHRPHRRVGRPPALSHVARRRRHRGQGRARRRRLGHVRAARALRRRDGLAPQARERRRWHAALLLPRPAPHAKGRARLVCLRAELRAPRLRPGAALRRHSRQRVAPVGEGALQDRRGARRRHGDHQEEEERRGHAAAGPGHGNGTTTVGPRRGHQGERARASGSRRRQGGRRDGRRPLPRCHDRAPGRAAQARRQGAAAKGGGQGCRQGRRRRQDARRPRSAAGGGGGGRRQPPRRRRLR